MDDDSKLGKRKTKPSDKGLLIESIVDHIDHICQLSGNTNHVMIGSDLDGGFGKEQCPEDLDTIADLQNLGYILNRRGYSVIDILFFRKYYLKKPLIKYIMLSLSLN